MGHSLPQLPVNAATLFLAHLVEALEKVVHLAQDRGLKRALGRKSGGFQGAGHAQNRVQVQYRRQTKLGRRDPKCLNIPTYDLPV